MSDVRLPVGRTYDASAAKKSPVSGGSSALSPRPTTNQQRILTLEDKVRALSANQQSYDTMQSAAGAPNRRAGGSAKETAATVAKPKSTFVATVQRNFRRWDTNNDGTLQGDEIDKAVANPKFKGKAATALAALNALEDRPEFAGFGASDLKAAESQHRQGNTQYDSLMSSYQSQIDGYKAQKNSLFGPDQVPSLNDITQGAGGDCYFLTAMGSKVMRDPQSVKDMITDNANGTYTVKFAAGSVTVPGPTEAQVARSSSTNGNGTWVPIVEKAFAEYTKGRVQATDPDAYETIYNGGWIEGAMKDLGATEVRAFNVNPSNNPNQLTAEADPRTALTQAFSQGKWVNGIVWKSPAGLPGGHAYTIESYDAATDTVLVRNPWGYVGASGNDKTKYTELETGQFKMKMDDFTANFSDIVVGTPPPVTPAKRFMTGGLFTRK